MTFWILLMLVSINTTARGENISQILWSENLITGNSYRWTIIGLQGTDAATIETGETVAAISTTDSSGNPTTEYETGTYTWTRAERTEYEITILAQLPAYDMLRDKNLSKYIYFSNDGIQQSITFELLSLLIFPIRFTSNNSQEYNLLTEISDSISLYAAELREKLDIQANDTIIFNSSYFQINGESSRQYLPSIGLLEHYTLKNTTHDIQIAIQHEEIDDMAASFTPVIILLGNLIIIVLYRKRVNQS